MALSPRGSVQDLVLREMVQRERYEQYQSSVHVGRVLAMVFGLSAPLLARVEETLELAVFQTAYDPRQIQEQMHQAQQRMYQARQERLRDARLLQGVARLSADDDTERAQEFKRALDARPIEGVKDPWNVL